MSWARWAHRFALRLLIFAIILYAGLCTALLAGQNRLLYPGTRLPPRATPIALPIFTDHQGQQRGWTVTPRGTPRGTIVFFHGNDEQAWQAARAYGPYFTARGWRVVFPEYRGFDFRAGEQPSHDTVIADALADTERARRLWPDGPLWLAGNSLGAGVAAQVARAADVPRILLFVPWDSLGAVAQDQFPFIRTALLLRATGTDYNSCTALAGLGAESFIVYAGRDQTIPARHARALARCLDVPKNQVIALPGATHDDWSHSMTAAQWNTLLDPKR